MVIQINKLTKKYGDLTAVDNLDLHIRKKEVFALLGPNGAGKTTTIRMLTMLTIPTGGKALINAQDVTSNKVKKEIGVVPQHMNLDLELTAWENLELHGRLHNMPRDKLKARINELLTFVEINPRAFELASNFSGGMKRRLMIARALMHYPSILFLDEPTAGLDPQTRRKIWDLIRRLNAAGLTVLMTTHYIEEAQILCHRVGIMDKGRLIALGTPQELMEKVGEVVVEFFGGTDTGYKFFARRQQALEYVSHLKGDFLVREVNLEDVFVEITGRKVGD
ncbi:ABC transporter ATPase [Peptococcaceae bacterium SCADC1_2_3]|jgi:ABC-2 type transport system ATP-binding protein|nr:ABC transporter ATPase [Peptococcaceae bacterium SCADC1_2_3]KFI35232.1 ABC transporter ATPase [Peptococcaceae bacterium SCADC1_2_3]KFI38108.1 ABC transporter ATPase [Peptococcaceae bacterium SCADC1_2_3]HBQ28560.1 ABC transporter ATP-binding protein [Desulfotomaculum sp.]